MLYYWPLIGSHIRGSTWRSDMNDLELSSSRSLTFAKSPISQREGVKLEHMLLTSNWTPYMDCPDATSILTARDLERSCSGRLKFKLVNFSSPAFGPKLVSSGSVIGSVLGYLWTCGISTIFGGLLWKYWSTLRSHWLWNKAHKHYLGRCALGICLWWMSF